jgi:hypothetical protein
MPYSDAVTINPKPVYDVDQLVVMLPNKMHFTAGPGAAFQPVHDPAQNDVTVQIASNTKVGQPLMFTLSGTNSVAETAPPNAGRGQSAAAREDAKTGEDSRPAAGALPPIAAPDPSSKSEWYLLGGFAVLLVAGTLSIARRSTKSRSPRLVQPDIPNDLLLSRATPELADQNKSAFRHLSVAALTLRDPMLRDPTLGDLKEQLFRLEVERKKNRIAQPDYEKAIATLHQSLDQAIKPGNENAITSAP